MTVLVYLLVITGALIRVAAPTLPVDTSIAMIIAGALWSAGFLLFAVHYVPVLFGSKPA